MKDRLISSAIIIFLLIISVGLSWIPFVFNGLIALIATVGLYEILKVSGLNTNKIITWCALPFTALFIFCSDPILPNVRFWLTVATFCLIVAAFAYYLRGYKTLSPSKLSFALAMTLLIAYFFSAMVLVRKGEHGLWNMGLIFILAWIPDTGAWFCGSAFGKHKLAPVISPKKTVEGAIGGVVFCVAAAYLYAGLVSFLFQLQVNYIAVAVFAILGSSISVLGDLTASLIKRYYKIKDYGNLIPGHGGIMDRFDSIWFVAPLVYFLCKIFPIFL